MNQFIVQWTHDYDCDEERVFDTPGEVVACLVEIGRNYETGRGNSQPKIIFGRSLSVDDVHELERGSR